MHFHVVLSLLLGAALLPAQQDKTELPRISDLGDRIDDIQDFVRDRKMQRDLDAIAQMRMLVATPDQLNPKDQAQIAKDFAGLVRLGRTRPPEQDQLYREIGNALAKLGEDGAKYLSKVIEDKCIRGREYAALRGHLLRSLGKTKADTYVDFLLEQALRSPDDEVMAAAGGALGEFTELELRPRREVVKKLISRFGEWHLKTTQIPSSDPNAPVDFTPQNAMRTLNAIRGPWNASLTRLTGQQFSNPPEWTHWLNKNRNWTPPR
jgi:hypothetical protein